MLLENKNAVIYGAGGATGGAVARAFAREGARVFLTGRRLSSVNVIAEQISAAGGTAEADEVDALDEPNVEEHLGAVLKKAGTIDVSFNAIGIPAVEIARQGMQGIPFTALSLEAFARPITTYTRAHFVTAKAAARRMVEQGSGVILMHTPEPGRLGVPLVGGMGPAWAAMEAFCRSLSAEVASYGVRVACLRSTGLPETETIKVVYGIHSKALGITPKQFQELLESRSHSRRQTTLRQLTDAAVFVASDRGGGMTGTVVNLTAGEAAD
jgi:NAD(P)-dependent dehydrogenase (short-subunit alcohol dehydrogenase family)